MKVFLNSIVMFIISWVWAFTYWTNNQNLWKAKDFASPQLIKPFVYRQLIPILIRGLERFGIVQDIALILIVASCGLGFYLCLRLWVISLYGENDFIEISVLISCVVGLLIFQYARLPYDLCTVFLFTLSFYLIHRKDSRFLVLFPIVVLNRETSFLLIIFYVVYVGFSLMEVSYLVAVFGSIQGFLHLIFWDNVGLVALVEPYKNLIKFSIRPEQTLIHLGIFSLFLFLIFYGRKFKSEKLLLGFLCVIPVSLVMYLVMGQAFEIRVFWEVYPLVIVLSIPTIKEFYYEMQSYKENLLQHRKASRSYQDENLVT